MVGSFPAGKLAVLVSTSLLDGLPILDSSVVRVGRGLLLSSWAAAMGDEVIDNEVAAQKEPLKSLLPKARLDPRCEESNSRLKAKTASSLFPLSHDIIVYQMAGEQAARRHTNQRPELLHGPLGKEGLCPLAKRAPISRLSTLENYPSSVFHRIANTGPYIPRSSGSGAPRHLSPRSPSSPSYSPS